MNNKNGKKYGPDDPHPLSARKTELVWEGKYDEYGSRREVDIAGCAMPMQKIETIDEPASRLSHTGLFDAQKAHKDDFRSLPTVSNHEFDKYSKTGKYTACVKVVDIFGCDTSITVEVEI